MTTQTLTSRSSAFMAGWIMLLLISGLATLNHLMLPLYDKNNLVVAMGWVPFSLYATLVLAIPFPRGERWAWFASWILVIGFALPVLLFDAEGEMKAVVGMYLTAAVVMALSLLLTCPTFFVRRMSTE